MRFNLDLKDIKYVKLQYKDSLGKLVEVKAALKSITNHEITICSKFEDGCNIEYPQNVVISIICSDGLYKTSAELKSIKTERPYAFLYLKTPENIEYQQNRDFFRIKTSLPCTYYVETEYDEFTLECKTYDISANGISIVLPNLLISRTPAELTISMPERKIKTKINYIRSEKIDIGYKVSFSFLGMSNSDSDYISQFCIKRQLEEKRSSIY